jgi:3-methyladenine DNA glycosylase AlkD
VSFRHDDARAALRALADPAVARSSARYFKTGPGQYAEGDRFIGVRVPGVRRVAREFAALPLAEVTKLLRSDAHEERLLALLILIRQYARGGPDARDRIYRLYLRSLRFVNNWDLVDVSAEHIVGRHLRDRDRAPLRDLARSPLLWERRVALLATFHYIKQGDCADTLALAEMLLGDREDLIHKAAGWMLREVGKRDPAVHATFLRTHARTMPRTMLRYAIERLPQAERKAYMSR